MKKIISSGLLLIITMSRLWAQDGFSPILEEIQKNNTTLQANQKHSEAEKLKSRTGIFLQNPEVGLNYLWGSPNAIGNRTDFSVTQTFDFPSAYKYKSNISDLQIDQADLEYRLKQINLLYEARLICIDLVFFNALIEENRLRLDYAKNIAEATTKMFEEGTTSILEYNKAQMSLANALSDNTLLEAEASALRSDLSRLNGGIELPMEMQSYPMLTFPTDFEEWYGEIEQSNPILHYLNRQVEISENEEKLYRAMSLPKFSAGYMSEKVVGEKYQGLSVGMSIPLWENKNSVKAARAHTAANLALVNDSYLQLYNILKKKFEKAVNLKKAGEGYYGTLLTSNNTELLKQAYDMGEISLIEYLVEIQFYYDTVVKALEAQREMHKAFAELEKWN